MRAHKGQYVFGIAVGVIAAVLAYRWATDPLPRLERQQEESAVRTARIHLAAVVGGEPEIVDSLALNRVVGKGYIYRDGGRWQVSGFYRRDENDLWHPYLMSLTDDGRMLHLKIHDPGLSASADPRLEIAP